MRWSAGWVDYKVALCGEVAVRHQAGIKLNGILLSISVNIKSEAVFNV